MTFVDQTWLWLIVLLPFIGAAAVMIWIRRGKRWHQMIAPRLRSRLSEKRSGRWHFISLFLALLGLGSIIIALAQPEGGEEFEERKTEGRNILFCLDISRSMLVEDVTPSRLVAAKAAAQEIMDEFPNDRAGLMIFAGETDVQVPLTIDRSYVRRAIQETTTWDLPTGGSDLARAIRDATENLVKTGQKSNVMILLSDGEEHTEGLANAAREARKAGIFVYALGFGTKAGGMIPDTRQRDGRFRDIRGNVINSALNDTSLRLIAQETDGVYSQGVGPAFLKKLGETINDMEAFESEGKHLRVAKPLFQWFLLPGILLIMISLILRLVPTLRHGATALILFAAICGNLRADEIKDGRAALEEKDFTQAARHFSAAARESSGKKAAQLNLAAGAASYQAKDWLSSSASFSEALRSDSKKLQEKAYLGLANSIFYRGAEEEDEEKQEKLWNDSIENLNEALSLNPDSKEIKANLEAVEEQLAALKKKQEEEKQQEEQKDQQQEQDQNQDGKDEQENQDQQNKNGEQDQKDSQNQEGENGEENKEEEGSDGQQQKEKDQQEKEGDQGKEGEEQKEGQGENEKKKDDSQNSQGEGEQDQNDQKNQQSEQEKAQQEAQEKAEKERQQKQQQQAQQAQQQQHQQPESPKELARRILRENADLGRRPPRQWNRAMPRRPLKDW